MDIEIPGAEDGPMKLRGIRGNENLLEGQFGQPVHSVVLNALRKPVQPKQPQQQKPADNQKKPT